MANNALRFLSAFIATIAIFIAGCSHMNEKQQIEVQKRIGHNNQYEDINKITDPEQVQKSKEILTAGNWESAKVERSALLITKFNLKGPRRML